jgi:hypothetical protein
MRRQLFAGILAFAAAAVVMTTGVVNAQILFSENFDSLAGSLGPSVNERFGVSRVTRRVVDAGTSTPWMGVNGNVPNAPAFSHTGPAGWTINNAYDAYGASVGNTGVPLLGSPDYGVDEWEGWSFANKDFWIFADDQTRSSFTKGVGTVAVADADEWDDLKKDASGTDIPIQGYMNTEMKTGNINVSAYQGQTLTFTFDSSWRPEAFDDPHPSLIPPNQNNQAAVFAASFDGAPPTSDVFPNVVGGNSFWDSNSAGGFYKPDAQNETITSSFQVPAGATNVQLKFGYYNAANDWWWAVDNLKLTDAGNNTVWSENFEGVTLGPSVNERAQTGGRVTVVQTQPGTSPYPNAFTHSPPAGWNVDNSGGLPGIGDPNQGVEEWEGWSFTTPAFWQFADTQDRQNFTKGTGVIATADPDEWDDLGDPEALGTYNSLLVTPAIDITGVGTGLLRLNFDSSWRDEDTQTAVIEVNYGSGFTEVLRWESVAGPNFHDDNANESVEVMLNNPSGATSAIVRFGLVNATDDWWWAVDNIVVSAVPEPSTALLLSIVGLALAATRRRW